MKRKFATLMLCLIVSLSMEAQQSTDSFFNHSNTRLDTRILPVETQGTKFSNMNVNVDAPIGNGMFILVAAGFIYTMLKKKEETR